jgi:hypothetical protein
MTLLNAPEFDEKKEKQKKNLLVGGGIFVVVMAALTVAGFFLGHGWLFINLPVEHRVSVFLTTVEAKDYTKAYGLWMNDPEWQQHPQKYDYSLQRFTEDFSTASDWKGPVTSFKTDCSRRDDSLASFPGALPQAMLARAFGPQRRPLWQCGIRSKSPGLSHQWDRHSRRMACSSGRILPSAAGAASTVPSAK